MDTQPQVQKPWHSGRRSRLLEFDPLYCDTIIRRRQSLTGKQARLHDDQRTFEEITAARQLTVSPKAKGRSRK